ncbi:hypothetical protein GMOD_00008104 [Pyrenophora seminiperda CCB06]|uniref:Uncharacterized protein n=1 Tax=Pyrenophora seminiperda CCB06 TaxID=1302712 RepID=A0A3M7MGV1_9PLEO|nr:hypothetical protein GMOD_00008104 [Pyrenophora seminiperda CCB06]
MRLLGLLFVGILGTTAGARPVLLGLGPYQVQVQIPLLGEKLNADSAATTTNSNGNGNDGVEMVSGAPSIGLHFTNSYAMASAHFLNGTTVDLFKMQADAGYTVLLSRWMDAYAESQTHAQQSPVPLPQPTTPASNTRRSKTGTATNNDDNPINILTPFLSKLHFAITQFEQTHGPITRLTPVIFPLSPPSQNPFPHRTAPRRTCARGAV